MIRCTLIIPVHNRREITLACLRHLRAIGDLPAHRAIVVDDGSTDGTAAAVSAEFPDVEILSGHGELWWTGAIALGMERAFRQGAEAVCWLNDDCLPERGTLAALLAEAAVPPGCLAAPACFDRRTGRSVPNAFVGRRALVGTAGTTVEAEGLSGFCVVVPRAVWTRIGVPDARRFPHYFGDNAYTLAATRAGFPARVLGAARAELTDQPDLVGASAPSNRAAGWHDNFARVFISPKSPDRLRTLFAYQRLKYGGLRGTVQATARAGARLVRFTLSGGR